jgi:hypothetical protein
MKRLFLMLMAVGLCCACMATDAKAQLFRRWYRSNRGSTAVRYQANYAPAATTMTTVPSTGAPIMSPGMVGRPTLAPSQPYNAAINSQSAGAVTRPMAGVAADRDQGIEPADAKALKGE